jgi:Galactose-3-O-sulfotransferase
LYDFRLFTGLYLGHPGKFGKDLVDDRFFADEEHFDVFTHHSRFSPEGVDEVMPEDTLRIAVLREPVALFQSLYNDYHLNNNVSDLYKGSLVQFLDSLDLEVLKRRTPQLSRLMNKIGINQVRARIYPNIRNICSAETLSSIGLIVILSKNYSFSRPRH